MLCFSFVGDNSRYAKQNNPPRWNASLDDTTYMKNSRSMLRTTGPGSRPGHGTKARGWDGAASHVLRCQSPPSNTRTPSLPGGTCFCPSSRPPFPMGLIGQFSHPYFSSLPRPDCFVNTDPNPYLHSATHANLLKREP